MKLSLSFFPLVNSQSVLRNFCMFISDIFLISRWSKTLLYQVTKRGFFHDPIKVMKIYSSSSSSRMAGTPMTCNSSRVKSINPKWLYFCSVRLSSSDRLNAWILFGLPISTMASCPGKCQSNHLS